MNHSKKKLPDALLKSIEDAVNLQAEEAQSLMKPIGQKNIPPSLPSSLPTLFPKIEQTSGLPIGGQARDLKEFDSGGQIGKRRNDESSNLLVLFFTVGAMVLNGISFFGGVFWVIYFVVHGYSAFLGISVAIGFFTLSSILNNLTVLMTDLRDNGMGRFPNMIGAYLMINSVKASGLYLVAYLIRIAF